jgi:trans-aconitate methyltransferase
MLLKQKLIVATVLSLTAGLEGERDMFGSAAYGARDCKKAYEISRLRAEQGHSLAFQNLGFMYEHPRSKLLARIISNLAPL